MNTLIKDAWVLFKKDIKVDKFSIFLSIIFIGYLGLMMSTSVELQLNKPLEISWSTDLLLLVLCPMLGFYYSKRSFKYLSEDSYTQMLIYLRSLPISTKVIMTYRYTQLLMAFMINGVIVFSVMYGLSSQLRSEMSIGAYICFALTWIGYALGVSTLYVHFEFMHSGKRYFGLTLVVTGITAIVGILINLQGGSLLIYTINMSKQYHILSPILWGALVVGVISVTVMSKFTIRKLQNRDLV